MPDKAFERERNNPNLLKKEGFGGFAEIMI